MDNGASELEIAEEYFSTWCRNYRAFARYKLLIRPSRTEPTVLIVYWGPSDSGKSRHAHELAGPAAFWLTKPKASGAWWDLYEQQSTVVIDEFYGWLPRDLFQRLADRYPLVVETKGGAVVFNSERIIVTSNVPPSMWWKKLGLGAMQRRLTEPLGYVFYMGNEAFPTEISYMEHLIQIHGVQACGGVAALPPGLVLP